MVGYSNYNKLFLAFRSQTCAPGMARLACRLAGYNNPDVVICYGINTSQMLNYIIS